MSPSSKPTAGVSSGIASVVTAYAVLSCLWIVLSDRAAAWLFPAPPWQDRVQTYKGWFFLAVTSVLLYALLVRLQAARDAALTRETEALRAHAEAARLLQTLADHSPDAIFAKDREGRYLLFNRAAARMVGMDVRDVIGRDDGALFPPAQAATLRSNDLRVMETATAQTFEEQVDTSDGPAVYLATKGPLQGPDGVVGMFGISRDITAMVRARQALAASEQRHRDLFEANPQAMWVFDLATLRFLDVNTAAIARYGYSRDEFLSLTLNDIRPPEHHDALQQSLAAHRPGVQYGLSVSGPWVHRRKDGCLFEVEISFSDLEFAGRHARLVLALDVTERQRLLREREVADAARQQANQALAAREAELTRSELRYRLASMGGHVWDWDVVGNRADYPQAFWQRLGHVPPPRPEATRFLCSIMHPDDRPQWQAALQAHLKAREPYLLEFRVHDALGRWHWFLNRGQAVWDDSGRATYMAGTTFDITDRHRAEDALWRTQQQLSDLAQRLLTQERETTTRLAHVLHDQLGQTLGSARLQLDLAISRPGQTDPVVDERLLRVSAIIDAAVADVRRLLVELRPPLLREQGLAAALEDEVQRNAELDAGVEPTFDAGPATLKARWPEAVEYAVFMIAREALGNALQHAHAGSVAVTLDGDAEGRRLGLRVHDDGRGIGDAELQGRPGHLGLVGIRERAIVIGARLSVQRAGGGGTEVRVDWEAPGP